MKLLLLFLPSSLLADSVDHLRGEEVNSSRKFPYIALVSGSTKGEYTILPLNLALYSLSNPRCLPLKLKDCHQASRGWLSNHHSSAMKRWELIYSLSAQYISHQLKKTCSTWNFVSCNCEKERSPHIPAYLACDACTAIATQVSLKMRWLGFLW